MEHGGNAQKGWAILAAVLGSAALVAYSIAGAFQTLVWNPLAAVPGATLGEIHGAMTEAGESLGAPRVIGWSAVGIAVAAAGMIGTLRADAPRAGQVASIYLALLVLAAPSHMFVAFTGGMGIADAFATSGGDHAPWGALLYLASGMALVALAGIAVWRTKFRHA
ncbi:hypothetical protein [Arthrobacter sp. EPSL27]|uniref:hypothetical protein n=1 Tax=Arthrobacter sp. EPSL27 TaxID=1745378 RepID=UPI000832192A|nr:hypothetical protein [Arthrobacter sp. EPSL27]